jgi:hypothetical protein
MHKIEWQLSWPAAAQALPLSMTFFRHAASATVTPGALLGYNSSADFSVIAATGGCSKRSKFFENSN